MPQRIQRQRPAMGTWFEVQLVGDDPEHLTTVADAVLDEVERVERQLSRFDSRSEIARINREAGSQAVLVDREVLELLLACQAAWKETGGYFDATASKALERSTARTTFADVTIDSDARTVRFGRPELALDLGGIGKGYALDRGARIVAEHGVGSAFLHGGTSSILALGCDEEGRPWAVGVRDPFVPHEQAAELARVHLSGRGLSCSATRAPGQTHSDIIDPHRALALDGLAACVAIAPNATSAEILSTALLCMGKKAAKKYFSPYTRKGVIESAWIEYGEPQPVWHWLT